tara:strand:- start:78 stop:617 length:540 start_codon:yes stop_codon:yes gene_type:complete
MLNSLITSKTRLRMLIKFFVSAANRGYLNGLAKEFNKSTNSIRKELNILSDSGYLIKSRQNNKIIYNADTEHPLFDEIQKSVRKHLGLVLFPKLNDFDEIVVQKVISRMGELDIIALTGNYARGIDSGIIEIVLIGNNINVDYLENIKVKIKDRLSRNVDFIIVEKVPIDGIILYKKEK